MVHLVHVFSVSPLQGPAVFSSFTWESEREGEGGGTGEEGENENEKVVKGGYT